MPGVCGRFARVGGFSPIQFTCKKLLWLTESTVLSGLSKLRSDKSMGPDGMAPRLLIESKDLISYPLQAYILFRKSLDESVVPEDWKEAIVTPIFKQGSRNRAENYRPVSLTCLVCKVYKIIHSTVIRQFSLILRILSPRSNKRTHSETSQTDLRQHFCTERIINGINLTTCLHHHLLNSDV